MKKWLARLFGETRGAQPAPALPSVRDACATLSPACGDSELDVDLGFARWLFGPYSVAGLQGGALVLGELARLSSQPQAAAELVPRVPAVIPQLLRSLRDEGSSSADLARQLGHDALLVAELIREVNTPYYRPATPIRNIEGALLLLGQNGLRMLLARVAFRPIISVQTGRLARQMAPLLWSQSEKCALAASLLAPGHGADPFEAYLAGLMHNVGLVVGLRIADKVLPESMLPDDDAFLTGLLCAARTLSAQIATEWELPPAVAHAIGHPKDDHMSGALALGNRLAALRILSDAAQPGFAQIANLLPAHEHQIFEKLRDPDD